MNNGSAPGAWPAVFVATSTRISSTASATGLGEPTGYDIEAIRCELSAEDHQDAVLPNDFETNGLPGPKDHADEIKAEMMRRLETRSASAAPPSESEEQPKETGDQKRS